MSEGWKCPNCGSAHAPDVKTCPAWSWPWPGPLSVPATSWSCTFCGQTVPVGYYHYCTPAGSIGA